MAEPLNIPAGGKKKGLDKRKKMLLVGGAAALLLLLLYVRSKSSSGSSSQSEQDAINTAAEQAALQQEQQDMANMGYLGSATGSGAGYYDPGSSSSSSTPSWMDPSTGMPWFMETSPSTPSAPSTPTPPPAPVTVTINNPASNTPPTTNMPSGPGTPTSTPSSPPPATTVASLLGSLAGVAGIIAAPTGSRTTKSGYVTVNTGGSNYAYVPVGLAPKGMTIYHNLSSTNPDPRIAQGLGHGLWAVPANFYKTGGI